MGRGGVEPVGVADPEGRVSDGRGVGGAGGMEPVDTEVEVVDVVQEDVVRRQGPVQT